MAENVDDKVLSLTELQCEILEWISGMLAAKRYGVFGIEITLHDGVPLSVEKSERTNYKRGTGGGAVLVT